MKINRRDLIAFKCSYDNIVEDPNELNELLNKYMEAYIDNSNSVMIYLDEIENLINIREHKKIVEMILNNNKGR